MSYQNLKIELDNIEVRNEIEITGHWTHSNPLSSTFIYDRIFSVFLGLQITDTSRFLLLLELYKSNGGKVRLGLGLIVNEKVKFWNKFTSTSCMHD